MIGVVKIKPLDYKSWSSEVYIDGVKVTGVTAIDYHLSVNEIPQVTLTLNKSLELLEQECVVEEKEVG